MLAELYKIHYTYIIYPTIIGNQEFQSWLLSLLPEKDLKLREIKPLPEVKWVSEWQRQQDEAGKMAWSLIIKEVVES